MAERVRAEGGGRIMQPEFRWKQNPWFIVAVLSLTANLVLMVVCIHLASSRKGPGDLVSAMVGLAAQDVGASARKSHVDADIMILNTASAMHQHHTRRVPLSQDDLLANNGVPGWDGPYLEERLVPPTGYTYSVDAMGHWTATGP